MTRRPGRPPGGPPGSFEQRTPRAIGSETQFWPKFKRNWDQNQTQTRAGGQAGASRGHSFFWESGIATFQGGAYQNLKVSYQNRICSYQHHTFSYQNHTFSSHNHTMSYQTHTISVQMSPSFHQKWVHCSPEMDPSSPEILCCICFKSCPGRKNQNPPWAIFAHESAGQFLEYGSGP